ncbi:MAG TPA: hypothetical protein VFS66_09685 [Acidimicrobiia bacterium]|nr:hypothetical protein [Acidimicrobiia bacterium]
MTTEKVFESEDGRRILGICVSEGPKTFRIMLTWPYDKVGHVIELSCSEVKEVCAIGSVPLGEKVSLLHSQAGNPR